MGSSLICLVSSDPRKLYINHSVQTNCRWSYEKTWCSRSEVDQKTDNALLRTRSCLIDTGQRSFPAKAFLSNFSTAYNVCTGRCPQANCLTAAPTHLILSAQQWTPPRPNRNPLICKYSQNSYICDSYCR